VNDFDFHFEWDSTKAAINSVQHGVDFKSALSVLRDPLAITIFDDDHSTADETRWITIGKASGGAYLVVVHTWEDIGPNAAKIRIISARNATRYERRIYKEEQ
jgi:uncharacterized DUF497 family protein